MKIDIMRLLLFISVFLLISANDKADKDQIKTVTEKKPKESSSPPKEENTKTNNFLQITNKLKSNPNELFKDVVASEDKYDSSTLPEREIVDYNNLEEVDEDQLENIIKDDLTGEEVKYQFD